MFKQRRRSNGKKGSSDGRKKQLGKPKSVNDQKKRKDSKIRNRRLMKMHQRAQLDEDDEPIYTGNRVRTISEIQKEERTRKAKKGHTVELPKLPDEIREQIQAMTLDDRENEDLTDGTSIRTSRTRPIWQDHHGSKVNRY